MKAYERTFLAKWRLVLVYWSVRNHKTVEMTDEILDLENFLEMMDESLSIFSPAVNISSVGCSHLSVIIQTVMTLLFVFDLHVQTNNYINLYKLTKWTVISNCSLVTDSETQIQLKFTVSWQPSDTYECISTKIHFHKVRVEPLDIFLVCKYLSRCLFLLWIEKQNILMSRSAINHSSLLNFHLVYGGRLVWKVKRRHHFVNQTNILKCKAIKKAKDVWDCWQFFVLLHLKNLNLLSTCAQVWNDG